MKYLLLLLVVVGCASAPPSTSLPPLPRVVETQMSPHPNKPVEVVIPSKPLRRTPSYTLPRLTPEYTKAVEYIKQYANSDEFWNYVRSKRTYYSHTKQTVEDAIVIFRAQLDREDNLPIVFYRPRFPSKSIGGWDGVKINENTAKVLTAIGRAGHLLHETSHKYSWTHSGNSSTANDNQNSFPYAVGYDLFDFLKSKLSPEVAAE